MRNPDLLIYAAHLAFWIAFGAARLATRGRAGDAQAPQAHEAHSASGARWGIVLHAIAFGTLYWSLGAAVLHGQVPEWFPGQRWAGLAVIAVGAALACWAVASFHSWRIQAQLEAGHQLATGGPFRFLRHPIYMALNLFALGTALWVPTKAAWLAVLLMAAGSEWRARIEERLLAEAFGEDYAAYRRHTARFIPGVY